MVVRVIRRRRTTTRMDLACIGTSCHVKGFAAMKCSACRQGSREGGRAEGGRG